MFWKRRRPRPAAREIASRLHAAAVAQSRSPALYLTMGAPDTTEGRFELLTLHIILLIERLKGEPGLRQDLFDEYVSNLDGALREMGVGDLAMAKRMKELGAVFYGRAKAYEGAFAALPDENPLRELLQRTILGERGKAAAALADYTRSIRGGLAALPAGRLLAGAVEWAAAT